LDPHIEKIGDLAVVECEGRVVRSEAAFKLREAVTSLCFCNDGRAATTFKFKLFNPTKSVRNRLELVNSIAQLDVATLRERIELLANADRRYALAA
jgi:hypothetical protein